MNTGVQRSGATPPGGAHREHEAGRRRAGQRLRPGQERAADRDGARDPVRRDRDRRRPARPRAKVERAMELRGARYLHVLVPCPLGWGAASHDTIRLARLAKETGLFPVFEAEHGEVVERLEDPPPRAGRGVPAAAAPLRPPVRRPAPHRRDRADPGARRPQHPPLRPAPGRRRVMDEALRDHARRRLEPRQQDRAAGAPSGPSTSTGCRRATTPARPARTSSSGSTRPRRAAPATSAPGGRSWRTTRSRP